jgi:hypothetical protein
MEVTVPTPAGKLFCLGLSRTGTTTFHAASVLLGLASAHYPAQAAVHWLRGDFLTDTLLPYDSVSDLPVPVYFRELDRRYPGSKFVLTVRDIDDWLVSVDEFFGRTPKSSPQTLLRDLVRAACYGVITFNSTRFRDVYERHLEAVVNHFRDRPDDLLIMDVSKKQGWTALCPFLGCPPPPVPFPHLRTPYLGPLCLVAREEVPVKRQAFLDLLAGRPVPGVNAPAQPGSQA